MQTKYNNWLNGVTPSERQELEKLANNQQEIAERFLLDLQFGTAGMRGELGLGTYRMNIYTVRRATFGVASYVASLGEAAKNRGVLIAYDTRRFSREFAFGAAEVLEQAGVRVHIFEDVRPVPMCSYAVRTLNAVVGIMITASHNPKEYNGYKVYGEDGAQMAPIPTQKVVDYIENTTDYFAIPHTTIANIETYKGKDNFALSPLVTVVGKTVDEGYYQAIEKLALSRELTQERGGDLKLVYTPVHGAGAVPVTTIFKRLGIRAEVVGEQFLPDGEFSTVQVPNPENAETMQMGIALGNQIGADVVIGTDPDCDRMGIAVRNPSGEFLLLTGNQIGVLLFDYIVTRLSDENKMPNNPALVRSLVSTTLADRIAKDHGVTTFEVLTGFKYIGEKIKEWEQTGAYTYVFGFEESFGSLCGTHARDKDAVVASMLFAELLLYHESQGKTVFGRLEELFLHYGYYTEQNVSLTYKGLTGMEDMARVMRTLRQKTIKNLASQPVVATSDYHMGTKTLANGEVLPLGQERADAVYFHLENGQFVCVRPSGTEPKLKLYVLVFEKTSEASKASAARVLAAIQKELGQ